MTHLYTLLLGGTVIPGGGRPDCSAICWAEDTVLLVGTDDEVRAISRGDSTMVDLDASFVAPIGDGTLEVGEPADLAVFKRDPRTRPGDGPVAVVRVGRVVEGMLPGLPLPRFGRNSAQVESLLVRLRELPTADWQALQDAHAASPTEDAAEEALAGVLVAEGLRDAWFELRAEAGVIARKAAADFAAETHEQARTIEHVASYDGWDGQHEKTKVEVLGPAHERGFIDAACGALGVLLTRPYIAARDFERFWLPYEQVVGGLDSRT